ncbi:MAG: RNB domain-containing ribonuclease, partial [Lentisphaeria bacterium]
MTFKQKDLILYKYRPAIVDQLGEKIEILLDDGSRRKVRAKDILFMTDGPAFGFDAMVLSEDDIRGAWEVLEGETKVSFVDLMDLIWAERSSGRALALWKAVSERRFFKFNGNLDLLEIVTVEEYEAEESKRLAKEEAIRRFSEFIVSLRDNKLDLAYKSFYQEIEKFAYGGLKKCSALQALEIESTLENAHELLLRVGYWDEMVNPYPLRNSLPASGPSNMVPELSRELRLDLTHLSAYAIDDEGNKDPDDAITLDGEIMWVHIADCGALVFPNSELDLVAQERISNQYLPEKIVSMLPIEVVEELGLGLKEISPALSFGIKLDSDGECFITQIVPSWVKVTRMSYREVNDLIDEEPFASMLNYTSRFH